MNKKKHIIFDENQRRLYAKAAESFVKQISRLLIHQKTITLGIVGGNSIKELLEAIGQLDITIPWHRIHLFMADERLVPVDSPESNFGQIKTQMPPKMSAAVQCFPFVVKNNDPDSSIIDYGKQLLSLTTDFDILLLSAGTDGHVASLFPQHPSIANKDDLFIRVDNAPKPPLSRMSASKALLEKSKCAFLFFIGKEKGGAFKKFCDTENHCTQCPAKLIENINITYLVTDQKIV